MQTRLDYDSNTTLSKIEKPLIDISYLISLFRELCYARTNHSY